METVNRAVHQVLKALMGLLSLYITPTKVFNNPTFYPYFQFAKYNLFYPQDLISAMDGSLIPTWVSKESQQCYSSRKGTVSQNVLAICDFDGKMYLVDAGFCNYNCFLDPYKSTRYYLQEFRNTGVHPTTPHELFNLRHSKLRNIVERCFGMLKSRFPVLRYRLPSYYMRTQVKIVIACCVLHNFI
ncbi:hypothetical protein ACS0TY_024514 [Phlomoides rotata]